MMNITETKAYNWLKTKGYKDVVFRRNITPDFVTDNGEMFEVKKSRNKTIRFSPGQYNSLKKARGVKILVFDGGNEPEEIIPFDELRDGQTMWGGYRLYGTQDVDHVVLNVWLDTNLYRRVKAQVALEGKTLAQWFTEILEEMVY